MLGTRLGGVATAPAAAPVTHVKRAVYQGGHVWGQMLVSTPELPSSCKWG